MTGKVKIRFDYENLTAEKGNVQVPFMVISAAILPEDIFSNVEVTDGKVLVQDDQNIAVGVAFPGLSESLNLKEYEPTEKVKIPESIEITVDAVDFELELTATIIKTCGLEDMDTDDLEDAEELADRMEELTDTSAQLTDGIGELAAGMREFQTYLNAYVSGVDKVNEGADILQNGLKSLKDVLSQMEIPSDMKEASAAAAVLNKKTTDLSESLKTIQDGLNTAENSLDHIDWSQPDAEATRQAKAQARDEVEKALANANIENLTEEQKEQILNAVDNIQIKGAAEEVQKITEDAKTTLKDTASVTDTDSIKTTIKDMEAQLQILESYSGEIQGLSGQVTYLKGALKELSDSAARLENGSSQLVKGIVALGAGVEAASKGAGSLKSGTKELADAGDGIGNGFGIITQGAGSLEEAMRTFDKEGIHKLSKLAGDDFREVITRIKALKEAEKQYNDKAGVSKNGVQSIQFIVETEEITD